jgi:superfamily II DNA or RNA helicase
MNSKVLSYRGYNIEKSSISLDMIEKIKEQLTVTPNIPEDFAQTKPTSFKLYQESNTRLYLPKYYGIKKFGIPDVNKLYEGTDIQLPFTGQLREYQKEAANKFLSAANDPKKMGGIVNVYCGWGKCLGKNTPIIMFNGTIKMVQDIVVGDILMGDDSTPRNVLSICRGREPLYKVCQDNGDDYIVNESHILSLKHIQSSEIHDIALTNLLRQNDDMRDSLMGYKVPIIFRQQHVSTDPYSVGCSLCLSKQDTHIPYDYKCNTRNVQLAVIAGVIDTCGVYVNDMYIVSINGAANLVLDIVFLSRSLGFTTSKVGSHTVHIQGNDLHDIPVKVVWKKAVKKETFPLQTNRSTPIHIEPIGTGDFYGFEIDGNKRFVLGDMTVTHNTTLAIHLICALKKKTLIVCHKDFLLQQWKERIEQFTTGARIGLLKAKTIDVEDKDIVLASLQSLSMKDYDEGLFKSFGFFIADEAHHCPAEVFSKALKKVNFKYALGLSATLKRKDGLTKVLKWYIGDVVYKAEKRNDELQVEFLEYYNPNPCYSLEVKGYQNKLNVSKMINNICDFVPRVDFIVQMLCQVLKREPERKVIILSDRRNHLELLQISIAKEGYEAAFYVGGMKQADLKESEEKQIILATYHIAAEGFDCPGLDTLILASPKSDVVQCVGRIQRTPQHLRKHVPLVLDIVDNFSLFTRQAKKRYDYYQSCNYDITGGEIFRVSKNIVLQGACFIDE